MTQVSIAQYQDIPLLVGLAKSFHERSMFAQFAFSPEGARREFARMIRSHAAIILFHEAGMIGGVITEYPFCHVSYAKEHFWYADEEGMVLLDAYIEWVNKKGADFCFMSAFRNEGTNPEAVARLYRSRNYVPIENSFVRKVIN